MPCGLVGSVRAAAGARGGRAIACIARSASSRAAPDRAKLSCASNAACCTATCSISCVAARRSPATLRLFRGESSLSSRVADRAAAGCRCSSRAGRGSTVSRPRAGGGGSSCLRGGVRVPAGTACVVGRRGPSVAGSGRTYRFFPYYKPFKSKDAGGAGCESGHGFRCQSRRRLQGRAEVVREGRRRDLVPHRELLRPLEGLLLLLNGRVAVELALDARGHIRREAQLR